MASMKRPRLRAVQALSNHRLKLIFIDDRTFTLDMRADVETYPGLKPLQQADTFSKVQLGDGGWTVEWPEPDIQLGADTLLLDALAQNAPDENTRTFIRWRATTGLALEQAAAALGVAPRTISRYSSGRERVPQTLALACRGWEVVQKEKRQTYA